MHAGIVVLCLPVNCTYQCNRSVQLISVSENEAWPLSYEIAGNNMYSYQSLQLTRCYCSKIAIYSGIARPFLMVGHTIVTRFYL